MMSPPPRLGHQSPARRNRLASRTEQLPSSSRQLYRIDHYSSQPMATVIIVGALIGLIALGLASGFPTWWVTTFTTSTSAVTLIMVFAIQHTAGREQTAIQRKLDELLRAVPEAAEGLMLLEEASEDAVREIEEDQREVQRSND
jgi:low affinity Fe/Cu permease